MSQDMKKLEDQLEKATAAGDDADVSTDAETASLREGWLAFGRLIETVQADLNGPPDLQYPEIAKPSRRRWPLGIKSTAALAASLLVAAVVGVFLLQNKEGIGKDRTEIAQSELGDGQAVSRPDESPKITVKDIEDQNAADGDELDWDSSLDTEIAAAGKEMLRIQADWHASYDPSSSIYYRMNAIQEDLNNNTL